MLYVFSQPLIGPANTTILPDQSEASKKHITLAQQYHLSLRQFQFNSYESTLSFHSVPIMDTPRRNHLTIHHKLKLIEESKKPSFIQKYACEKYRISKVSLSNSTFSFQSIRLYHASVFPEAARFFINIWPKIKTINKCRIFTKYKL